MIVNHLKVGRREVLCTVHCSYHEYECIVLLRVDANGAIYCL
jgi:hypothetical protein